MFTLALFIGIYSYLIFFLGIFRLLTKVNVLTVSFIWFLTILMLNRKNLVSLVGKIKHISFEVLKTKSKLSVRTFCIYLLVLLIFLQTFINLVGALGPELAFDALWYHLTLPKLYLLHHTIYHIPGGLLYYSDMPKLGEMLYVGALSFGNEIFAKALHFLFGILITLLLYKFSNKFFSRTVSLVIIVIFYSNLVVDWESIIAYIDLIRTFFELLALWGMVNWYESKSHIWLAISGFMIGLAITTKVLATSSFFILLLLSILISLSKRKMFQQIIFENIIFTFCAFIVPLPWFIFSYLHTGNPVFPFFTKAYEVSANSPNPFGIFSDLWNLFNRSADPISPVYLIFMPFLFVFYSKMSKRIKIIILYSGLSLIFWYFTPRTGGGRFILPYLPAFSIICGAIYSEILKKTGKEWKYLSYVLFTVIVFVSLISIGYRGLANKKYIPVIIGKESEQNFLTRNLNFRYGDFYDTDGYFRIHIKPSDTVLLYGFHNLYYTNFTFIDNTWVRQGDVFDYIAVQNSRIPSRFKDWKLVYSNAKTLVQLYKPPQGECPKKCNY